MGATTELIAHEQLREQYATALRIWSETCAVYGAASAEFAAANALVESLEQKLKQHPPVARRTVTTS